MTDQTKLLEQLVESLDALEAQLRIYDKALRFAEDNYPSEANIFKFCLEQVQIPGLPDFASEAHRAMLQGLRERVSRALQDYSSEPSTEENHSSPQ